MSGAGAAVVLVGDRRAAFRAARAADLPVVHVVPYGVRARSRRRGVVERIELPAAGATNADWSAVLARIARHAPRAIVALGEGTVAAAARVRGELAGDASQIEIAARCTDKILMKRAARAAGIPCAELVEGDDRVGGPELADRLGVPFVVKPRVGSGGRGARWVGPGAPTDFVLPVGWIAERAVPGAEMSVEAIVRDAAPLFVNFTEYLEPRWANLVPAAVSPSLADGLRALLDRALAALGVRDGFVHMEVFVDGRGAPVFGELAWRPPGGHIMTLIERAYGFDPWRALLVAACGGSPDVRPSASRVAAMRLIHPGPGTVTAVLTPPGLGDAVCVRVAPGDRLEPRLGAGQEAAHVIVDGDGRDAVVRRLAAVCAAVRIDVRPD